MIAFYLIEHGEVISSEINKRYDSILLNETSFGKKYEYLKKIPIGLLS